MTDQENPAPKEHVSSDVLTAEFDIDTMLLTKNITDVHQEGNWLCATTDNGVKFRQHIKQGKRLNKIGGKFVLENVEIV